MRTAVMGEAKFGMAGSMVKCAFGSLEAIAEDFDFQAYLEERTRLIQACLAETVLPTVGPARRLHEAMRYSLLAGGKRLRPILALASCEAVGGRLDAALGLACAVEMVHTYSMVHDDLPCMDDDDLRRGKPTNHKVFGEALATLAGDALLTDAFRVLALSTARGVPAQLVLETVAELAEAAGSAGMVAGQHIDLESEGRTLALAELEHLHSKKTGALFLAAVRGGARLGGATAMETAALSEYARDFGLAFQVVDDLLDVESSPEQLGKGTQKDQARGKNTYPSILGVQKSRELAHRLGRRAREALRSFDHRAEPLRHLVTFAVERKR